MKWAKKGVFRVVFCLIKSSAMASAKALLLTINCSAFDEQKQCFSTSNSTAFEGP